VVFVDWEVVEDGFGGVGHREDVDGGGLGYTGDS
jgi:hypothetical protein